MILLMSFHLVFDVYGPLDVEGAVEAVEFINISIFKEKEV
jgi:hypothetical protein